MAPRRSLVTAILLAVVGCAPATHGRADDYPNHAVTLIVPYPAGGGVDAMARLVAAKLSAPLGQQIIVENRGGGGNIAARAVPRAAPDGYTLLLGGAAPLTNDLIPPALGNIQSGNLRAIAVTSATRTRLLPDVPTVAESGLPGFEAMLHFGLLAPAGTPRPVIDRLNSGLKTLLASQEARKAHRRGRRRCLRQHPR